MGNKNPSPPPQGKASKFCNSVSHKQVLGYLGVSWFGIAGAVVTIFLFIGDGRWAPKMATAKEHADAVLENEQSHHELRSESYALQRDLTRSLTKLGEDQQQRINILNGDMQYMKAVLELLRERFRLPAPTLPPTPPL